MKLFCKLLILFVGFVLYSLGACAQEKDLILSNDLSKINIELLTDDEIRNYRDHLVRSGISEVQGEQLAIQKGISRTELLKLKARLEKIKNLEKLERQGINQKSTTAPPEADKGDAPNPTEKKPRVKPDPFETYVFGSEIFLNNTIASFEPDLRIATPKNYTLGPNDELVIDLYGYQEVNYKFTISPEGTITIPYVGVISLVGSTVEQATRKIRDRMTKNGYSTLASGQSKLEVNVGRIKSIKVTLVGQARTPGSYTVSGLANMFNALYEGGGITKDGSFRKIELIRNNRVIDTLDIYDFLLRADLSNNKGLMDQDVIRIPVADIQVEVRGEVKREGIFEMLPGETINDLIRFTGGFTDEAYTAGIHIQQLTDKERQLKDLTSSQFASYTFRKGDIVFVDRILNTFSNRVIINGAVQRPGQFELTPGLTLSALIKKADGLRQDAFKDRASLIRTKQDRSTEILPFNVNEILAGGSNDIVLQKEDNITIASIFEYKENYRVTIQGEVRKQGDYTYVENLTLKDLLFQAGGFTDAAAPQQIEIARRMNSDTTTLSEQRIAQVIDINSPMDLLIKGANVELAPWDIVIVRTKLGYKPQVSVRLEGEVAYPGPYVLETKEDRISDLIKRAGGLTPQAYIKGAYLTRLNNVNNAIKSASINRVEKIQEEVNDTTNTLLEDVTKNSVTVGIELDKILANPKSIDDIFLLEGDILTVGKSIFEIKVNGEIMFPTQVIYRRGEKLRYYIDKAGGFTDNARKKRTYVLYPNGSAGKTRKFLFFKSYPSVEAGSEILVPRVPAKKEKLSTSEIVALSTGVASLVGIFVALLNFVK